MDAAVQAGNLPGSPVPKMERRDFMLPAGGLKLHVTEWGPVEGEPVVMLHGIRGYAETFAGVAAALGPRYRVVAYDQRGRGESDWDPVGDYYTDNYVSDLAEVVGTLGLQRFHLLGHSMGGINAIVYASQAPQRLQSLIIEDAGPGAFEHSPGATRIRGEFETTPAGFPSWKDATDFMRKLRPSVSEAAREQRLRNMLKPVGDGSFLWRYDHAGIGAARLNPKPERLVDLRAHVPRIQCPTLVVRGGRSDYLSADMTDAMAEANPHIRCIAIPDAGHYVHDDQPQLFNTAVQQFLAEQALRR